MRDFHHAQLVGTTAQVEEAEMGHQAAAHHLVGRHGGVEATGHQYQRLLQGAQRVAADALVLAMNNEDALVANLQAHFHVRGLELDAGSAALLAQLAANITVHVHRAEGMLAGALATHGKHLAR
ncbi:hypothetical protein D3C80_1101210 [compost metagenome]